MKVWGGAIGSDREGGRDGDNKNAGMHSGHARPQSYDPQPSFPEQPRDGARQVFADQADIACTKHAARVSGGRDAPRLGRLELPVVSRDGCRGESALVPATASSATGTAAARPAETNAYIYVSTKKGRAGQGRAGEKRRKCSSDSGWIPVIQRICCR